MARLRYNGLVAELGADLAAADTTITFAAPLAHSGGTAVPTITGSDYIPLAILDINGVLKEIVNLTAYTSGAVTGTISRAQESTIANDFLTGATAINAATTADFTSSSSVGDYRWSVGSGQTTIDEFNDNTLDAAWTRVDGTGAALANATWAEGADSLSVRNEGGDTNGAFHGLVRPIGAALSVGQGFMTYGRLMAPQANYAMAGIVLSDGTTHGSGAQVHASIIRTTSDLYFEPWGGTNWTSAASIGTAYAGTPPVTAGLYFRIIMTAANTWQASMSPDGVLWFDCPAGAKTLTPTHVGFATTSRGTSTKHIATFEFLRRI